MIICPNCKNKLNKINNTYKCCNNHSFDISKDSYLNLLLNKPKAGDNQKMIKSRKEFLEKGYFDPLVNQVITSINSLYLDKPNILDIGCADGYYTNLIAKHYPNTIGMDISKEAIKFAARKYKERDFFVANGRDIPISNKSVDIILNIFAPHFISEYSRILKDEGSIIKVTPNSKHLFELKEILYDNVYLTKEKQISEQSFNLHSSKNLSYQVNLLNEDIQRLFSMTPYLYTTTINDIEKIKTIHNLTITLDFKIAIYKKNILI